jgi:uncharacterized Zn-binding protein involved in type VI secretion
MTPGTPPVPHVGGPVQPPCSTNVQTNNLAQARGTDRLTCSGGPPNFIVTGSGTVLVNNLPAARLTSKTMHPPPGFLFGASPNVLVGGPDAGVTLGNPAAGAVECQKAAGGRASQSTHQSYGNCGVESARQIINRATGGNVSEQALLDSSLQSGNAEAGADPVNHPEHHGGTFPEQRQNILAANGVPSTQQDCNMANITQAVAEGRGVITSHDVSVLWGPNNTGGHAIVVTGIQYDANGNPVNVIVNDTGKNPPNCSVPYPVDTYRNSLSTNNPINVTSNPIW